MKNIISILFITTFVCFINPLVFSQEETIRISEVDFHNTALLFQKLNVIGKHCEKTNGIKKHCLKEEKILDNNIEELQIEFENTLSYLNIKNEFIQKEKIEKEIYKDKNFYRYIFISEAKISKKGNSCFSNPGALIFKFYMLDRKEDKKYIVELDYTFFTCDIQILVNDINKNIKKQ